MHSEESCHDREQRLCRADIACRLLSPDVLLARLHRHAERLAPFAVNRHADDTPGHRAFELVTGCKERRMGPSVTQGDAKSL